ncbi:MAG: FG-GAP repeat protein, partial [Planctomycetota bacterium JB042]
MFNRTPFRPILARTAVLLVAALTPVAGAHGTFQEDQLFFPTGVAPGDQSGRALAVSGDLAVVGATGDDDNGSSAGAAFVFRRVAGTWVEEQQLLAND